MCVRVLVSFFFFLPLSLLLLYLFLPLIKEKKKLLPCWQALRPSPSLPPGSWQTQHEMPSVGRGGCSTQARYLTQCSRSGRAARPGSPRPSWRRGSTCHGPPPRCRNALWMVISNIWQLQLDGEEATDRGPGSQRTLCHAKPPPCGWRHRPGAGGTQGLCQPQKGDGSSQTQPPSMALTAELGPTESTCRASVYLPASVSR